jgi:hypothetical protein
MDMSRPGTKHLRPMGLNPQQVKRRETLGVTTLLLAAALLLAGLFACTNNWLTGLVLVGGSFALGSLGAHALKSIPDLLASADESY